jgi:hypothetical protein
MPKSLPFSIYRRVGRRYFYVSFKNEKTDEYFPAISTKQESEKDAIATAFKWLREGIPVKSTTLPAETYTLRKMAEAADLTRADAEYICQELRRRGFLETFVLSGTKMARFFVEFLTEFWGFDKSPYILEKLRKQHSIHRMHCNQQRNAVSKYWKPFFGERLLGELGQQDIDAFINSLIDAPISASWKNVVIKAGTKPLRWAYSKGHVESLGIVQLGMFTVSNHYGIMNTG